MERQRASKRARKPAKRFEGGEELTAEEHTQLAQALRLSRKRHEHADADFGELREAPVFTPSEAEFAQGPIRYIAQVRGVVCEAPGGRERSVTSKGGSPPLACRLVSSWQVRAGRLPRGPSSPAHSSASPTQGARARRRRRCSRPHSRAPGGGGARPGRTRTAAPQLPFAIGASASLSRSPRHGASCEPRGASCGRAGGSNGAEGRVYDPACALTGPRGAWGRRAWGAQTPLLPRWGGSSPSLRGLPAARPPVWAARARHEDVRAGAEGSWRAHAETRCRGPRRHVPFFPAVGLTRAARRPLNARTPAPQIRAEAEPFGICRIVPPASWCPPVQLRDPLRPLETKSQDVHAMSEGHTFGEGKQYTAGEYEMMAREFERNWDARHAQAGADAPGGVGAASGLDEEARARALERYFWRVVDTEAESLEVQYANDLNDFSAFPREGPWAQHAWNLNNIPKSSESLLRFMGEVVPGIDAPWGYLGMRFSAFCWHTEDNWLYSVNYNHRGAAKRWYGVSGAAAPELERAMRENVPSLFEADPALLHHLVTLMPPTRLKSFGVPVTTTWQRAGDFIVTFPRSYHAGFNEGFNHCEAVNFAPPDWLEWGARSRLHYRRIKRPSLLRFEDMLFRYAAHCRASGGVGQHALGQALRALLREEQAAREQATREGTKRSRRVRASHFGTEAHCAHCKAPLCLTALVATADMGIGHGAGKTMLTCALHGSSLRCAPAERTMLYTHDLGEIDRGTRGFVGGDTRPAWESEDRRDDRSSGLLQQLAESFREDWRARAAAWCARAHAALSGAGSGAAIHTLLAEAEEFAWGDAEMADVRRMVRKLEAATSGHIMPDMLPVCAQPPRDMAMYGQ